MILIVLLVIVAAAVSAFLAYLSLYDYQDLPPAGEHSVYLIRNLGGVNEAFLSELNKRLKEENQIVSLEKLFKGNREALLIYGPKHLVESFPELDLLELEDYTRIPERDLLCWEIVPKPQKHKTDLVLPTMDIGDSEQIFYQIALQKNKASFQATIRVVVVSSEITGKLRLMNTLNRLLQQRGFIRKNLKKTSATVYKAYRKRTATPKEIFSFNLKYQSLLKLLSLN